MTEFIGVFRRGAFGHRDRELIAAHLVESITPYDGERNACSIHFTSGRVITVEGTPDQMKTKIASALSDDL